MSRKWSSDSRSPGRFSSGISSSTFSKPAMQSSGYFGSSFAGIGSGFSSRVPKFQPPSYYAAAAGLPVSPRAESSSTTTSIASPSKLNHSTKSQERPEDFQPTHYPPDGTPLSYPTTVADAPDAFQEQAPARKRSLSRPLSRAKPRGHGNREHGITIGQKGGKQMAEIPFLETQLLPSLRDTIDRMTHPPTQHVEEHPNKQHEEDSGHMARLVVSQDKDTRSTRSPILSSGYTTTSSGLHPRSIPNTPALATAPSSPHIPYTPNLSSERSPRTVGSKIPGLSHANKLALRVSPKSAVPQLSSMPNTPNISSSLQEKSPGKSLRSTKPRIVAADAAYSPRTPFVSLSMLLAFSL
jgi:hypothetical protein